MHTIPLGQLVNSSQKFEKASEKSHIDERNVRAIAAKD